MLGSAVFVLLFFSGDVSLAKLRNVLHRILKFREKYTEKERSHSGRELDGLCDIGDN